MICIFIARKNLPPKMPKSYYQKAVSQNFKNVMKILASRKHFLFVMQVEGQAHFCLLNTDEFQVDHVVDDTTMDLTLDAIEDDFPIDFIEDQKKEVRSDIDIALNACGEYFTDEVAN